MEYCIVYLSSSSGLLTDDTLAHILKHSQAKNRAQGITGILLYLNGSIIQVLEGEEERVKALYNVINRDPQHNQVIKLYSGSIEYRSFADWSMGYKTLSTTEFNHLRDTLPFINRPTSNDIPKSNMILSLVRIFYANNHRN